MVCGGETIEAFERDLKEAGYHYDGEDKNAERFETSPAYRVRVLVMARDELHGNPDDGGAQKVKSGIDKRSQHGEGAGENYDSNFSSK